MPGFCGFWVNLWFWFNLCLTETGVTVLLFRDLVLWWFVWFWWVWVGVVFLGWYKTGLFISLLSFGVFGLLVCLGGLGLYLVLFAIKYILS